ncbi:MAG: hypothetical protein A2W93_00815 [Bacteroidetes bacterium GWF2_43_63]|nr:MAG: hypothetical protein A2W94_15115 [Bacteroidetes bacterium GWE2_42_42]OFY54138.1 MAG: hypothetical protein A2W93_00815 [Bacteroidetes bacterium GWF2_43_63]HBG70825.1 hypothetical protein [Bacteroidales bacterium]HCB61728.1 hypothetical protein [Bacteroidales bacterium]HCY22104.1 hypothetical protein [Bacteroidales bacterium]
MKAIFLLTASLCATFMSFAQNKCDFAEMKTISELTKMNYALKSFLVRTNDEKHVLVVEKSNKLILQKIGNSGVEIEKEFSFKFEKIETFFLNAFAGKEQLYIFSGFMKDKELSVCKTAISLDNLEVSAKTEVINSFPCKEEYFDFADSDDNDGFQGFKIISSPDNNNHALLFIDKLTSKDSILIDCWMYSSEMELQWKKNINKEHYEYYQWTFYTDNFGNLQSINQERYHSLSPAGISESNYYLTSYLANGNIVGPLQFALPEGKIYDYKMDFPANGIVHVGGLYYNGTIVKQGLSEVIFRNGVYCLEIDLFKNEITKSDQVEFDQSYISSHNYNKQIGNGLLFINTKKIITRDDGGVYVIAEFSVIYNEEAQFLDISTFSFDKSFDFEWIKNIRKDQKTENGVTGYWMAAGSFLPLYVNESLFIIYNDNINNLSISEYSTSVEKWKTKSSPDNIVCIAQISKSGDLQKYILDQSICAKGQPFLSTAKILSDKKSLYVLGHSSIAENHVLIQFE